MPDSPDPNFDPDSATIPLSGPRPTLSGGNVDLPLPEELAKLLPAGAYEVTDFLGAGGMGAVYKGMQVRLKRPVAIKIMRRDVGKDHDFEARFEREAQAMAKLNHPNIISVIDFGEAGPDYLFIVMELVDGTDLMDVIRSKQMTQEMALTLLPQICDALQFAHDHGIVHRDIKPSNIMLTRDGRVKMADFGLAKHFDHAETGFRTQTGTGMGTPDYAAPEQFDPTTPVDHRADIYALGVMIYQMITGALPRGVWRPPSQRAPVSTQWDAVVSRAMQNDPAERYQKASEVKTELSSIPLHSGRAASPKQPSPATPPSGALGQSALPKSRTPLLLVLIGGAVVIAVGAFYMLRDTAPRSGGLQPPSQAAATSPGSSPTPGFAPPAPTPAVQNTPLLAPPLPESGWKPLFAKQEWENSAQGPSPGVMREFKDGLVHMTNWANTRPQPGPDGAIRSVVVIRQHSHTGGVIMRSAKAGTYYKFGPAADAKAVHLYYTGGGTSAPKRLGLHNLPRPLKEGDKLRLELRIQGGNLTCLLDGKTVIEAKDQQIEVAGEWGIHATDAWFESVEVQPLPAAALASTAQPTWQKLLFTAAEASSQKAQLEADGSVSIDGAFNLPGIQARNIAVRAEMRKAEGKFFPAKLRWSKEGSRQMEFFANDARLQIQLPAQNQMPTLALLQFPKQLIQPGEWVPVEFAVIGERSFGKVRGVPFPAGTSTQVLQAGGVAFTGAGSVRNIEVLNLDGLPEAEALRLLGVDEKVKDLRGKTGAVPPSPSLPVSSSPSSATKAAPLEPGAIRLWDAPEKLTSTPKGISWKDDALLIHSSVMAVRVDNKPLTHRDSIVRFSLRMNRDAQWANVIVRDAGTPAAPRQYKLSIHPPTGVIKFLVANGDTERVLLSKPLPRPYAPEEWLRVELRSVGDDFTVSLDGQPLETVHDATLPNRGLTHFGATANAYFRDIVYVPLDEPAAVSSSPNLPVPARNASRSDAGGSKSSAATATKDAPFTNSLGMKFVPVPITGGPTTGKRVLFSVWPVRAQDFDAFLKEQAQTRPKTGFEEGPAHPAIGINWFDAQAFCAWLTTRERTAGKLGAEASYRLPSDHEWSCALEIGAREDVNKPPAEKHLGIPGLFPWGTQWPPPKDAGNFAGEEMQPALAAGKYPNVKAVIASYKDGFVNTSPVGSFPASRLGLHDMTGNVWQWCEDWADASQKTRVLRGGSSQDSDPKTLHITYRNRYLPEARFLNHGFRVVLEAK